MIPRIGVDLEPGVYVSRAVPELDLLDIAYGAAHGGAHVILVPISAFVASAADTPDRFDRPGLPLFAVKTEVGDLDRVVGLGAAPDRIIVVGERNRLVADPSAAAQQARQAAASDQEVGVLVEAEAAPLKELSRAHVQWAYFSTEPAALASGIEAAQTEVLRLSSAALAAHRLGLRVALLGPTGRQLPSALARIEHVEEIYPAPDLWGLALRLGWEGALSEYQRLMR